MLRLLDDQQMRETMGIGARAAVVKFDTNVIVPQVEEIYDYVHQAGEAA